ncbi:hypothetical protein GGI04_001933 [Coemansia thaxteri]|nr:hypothetical protein GGI04_001933 [Coemansia thaxteri]KAJ2472616.1 hypothetical protein GGI02_001461 [Coemansia sp. RSA 2322]
MEQQPAAVKALAVLLEQAQPNTYDIDEAEAIARRLVGPPHAEKTTANVAPAPKPGRAWTEWDRDALRELARTGSVASSAKRLPLQPPGSADDEEKGRVLAYTAAAQAGGGSRRRWGATVAEALGGEPPSRGGGWTWVHVAGEPPTAAELQALQALAGVPREVRDVLSRRAEWSGAARVGAWVAAAAGGVAVAVCRGLAVSSGAWGLAARAARRLDASGDPWAGDQAGDHAGRVAHGLLGAAARASAVAALAAGAAPASGGLLHEIGVARRRVAAARREVAEIGAVIRAVIRLLPRESGGRRGEAEHLATVGLLAACAHCEAELARAHAAQHAGAQVELSRAGVGVGAAANRWLLLAGILLPMQFVTGLFGQNVVMPWKSQDAPSESLAPWLVIAASLVAVFAAFVGYARMRRVI